MKLLPVPRKQFQPSFNICCGGRKKKKLRESEILHRIDSSRRESEETSGEASSGLML